MASGAVLDLDDPGIGIEAQLAREALLDLGLRRRLHATAEEPIRGARIVEHALRRRPEQLGRAVKPVELDEDGAGLLCPAPAYRRERALGVAAPDIGRDPDRRFEAHRPLRRAQVCLRRRHDGYRFGLAYSSGRPVIAVISRITRSDAWPVIGSLRSRSNFSIAACVSASTIPLALIWP